MQVQWRKMRGMCRLKQELHNRAITWDAVGCNSYGNNINVSILLNICTVQSSLKKFRDSWSKHLPFGKSSDSGRETWRFTNYTNLETVRFPYRTLHNPR
jgi:hypothetical protein